MRCNRSAHDPEPGTAVRKEFTGGFPVLPGVRRSLRRARRGHRVHRRLAVHQATPTVDDAALAEAASQREEVRRAEAIQRCWDRYVEVVDHADEIGVRLTTGLLGRITDTAAALGDRDLVEFSRQFTLELFAATSADPSTPDQPPEVDNGRQETR